MKFRDWQVREGSQIYMAGIQTLSNTAVLAHIVRSDEVAENIMSHFETLDAVSQASVGELDAVKGVTVSHAESIVAAFDIGRRVKKNKGEIVSSPDIVYEICKDMAELPQEELHVLMLNTKNQIQRRVVIHRGTADSSMAHPRDVFREAVKDNAVSIVLVHNHPSGNPKPSSDDIELTKKMRHSADVLQIRLLDHIIIGTEGCISLKEEGVF